MTKEKSLVIVGNGMATGRLLDDLLAEGGKHWAITVIGEEPHGGYNRIMLSSVLAREATVSSIISKSPDWFAQHGVRFYAGEKVVSVDRANKKVVTDAGRALNYDHLVMATGSRPSAIDAANQQLNGVVSFRTLEDVDYMERLISGTRERAEIPKALVIGGGFLGLEAAYGLALQGAQVTVIHRSKWLLNRQLDRRAAMLLQRTLEHKNIQFLLEHQVRSFIGSGRLSGAKLTNGKMLECQLAVVATGITPNVELAKETGLKVSKGIVVNEFLQTSDDQISALGECVTHQGETYGLVDPIWHQSQIMAKRLCEKPVKPFVNQDIATKLKISGVKLFSMGAPVEHDQQRAMCLEDEGAGVYRKCIVEDDRLVGVVLYGDTSGSQFYSELIKTRQSVKAFADGLVFGPAFFSDAA